MQAPAAGACVRRAGCPTRAPLPLPLLLAHPPPPLPLPARHCRCMRRASRVADTFCAQPRPVATDVAVQAQRLTLDVVGLTAFSHDFGQTDVIARWAGWGRAGRIWRAVACWPRLRCSRVAWAADDTGEAVWLARRDLAGAAPPSASDQDRLLWAVNAFGQVRGERGRYGGVGAVAVHTGCSGVVAQASIL